MEFISKSSIAEDQFQKASYYIIQERQSLKDMLVRAKLWRHNNLHVADKTPQ